MALYSRQIDNYIGGVSQQAYNLRYANQFNEQINCVSSVVNGLIKRPPTEFVSIKKYEDSYGYKVKTHKYSRGNANNENFLISIVLIDKNGFYDCDIHITDLNGKSYPVEDPESLISLYLLAGNTNPSGDYKFLSLEDTTFILNTTKIVKKGGTKSPASPLKAMVYVKQTDYGKEFKINVAGTEVAYETPDGSESSHSKQTGTDYVAEQLSTKLTAAGKTNEIVGGNIIVINLATKNDVLETSDGLGGRGLLGIKSVVNSFEDLPKQAPDGFTVKVINTDEIDADDYYTRFDLDGSGSKGVGSWSECVAPEISIDFDKRTMPIMLQYDKDNEKFILKGAEWDVRNAGDDDTNPYPSFADTTINSITTYQDRLVLLTETFVVLSKKSNYFNFFRDSVISLRDDAVLDVGSNSYDSYKLHSAVPWNEVLVLFSRDQQFILRGNGTSLTPKTISINQSGSYESNEDVTPVGAGNNLIFSANNGNNTNVYEMYSSNYENLEARNTTSHVSNYIPKNIKAMEVLDVYNMSVMLSNEDLKTLYVYQYLFNGSEKVQSAYHKWTFDVDKILSFKFIDNDMYMICEKQNDIMTFKMEINDLQVDEGLTHKIHLDNRITESSVSMEYNTGTGKTTLSLPFYISNPEIITRESNVYPSGYILTPESISGNLLTFNGDITNELFYVGAKYLQYLEHSTMTSINPQTQKVDIGGTVKLLKHSMTYDKTGYFKVNIERVGGNNKTYEYYSKKLNDYMNDFEEYNVKSGVFKYSVKGENTQVKLSISNDSHLPCNIQSSEYAYRFYKTTK